MALDLLMEFAALAGRQRRARSEGQRLGEADERERAEERRRRAQERRSESGEQRDVAREAIQNRLTEMEIERHRREAQQPRRIDPNSLEAERNRRTAELEFLREATRGGFTRAGQRLRPTTGAGNTRPLSQWSEPELMNAAKLDDTTGDALYGEEVRQAALDELQRRLGTQRTPPTAPPINVPAPRQSGTAGGRTYRPENPFR